MKTQTTTFPLIPWTLVLAWIGVIVVSSVVPPSTIHRLDISMAATDRALHAVAYGVLAFFLVRALEASGVATAYASLLAFSTALTLGAAMELFQPAVGRSAELVDWYADGLGAGLAIAIRAASRAAVSESR